MRKLLKRIEAALSAVAFAEEGEVETARQLLAEDEPGAPAATPPAERPSPRRPTFPRPRVARLP